MPRGRGSCGPQPAHPATIRSSKSNTSPLPAAHCHVFPPFPQDGAGEVASQTSAEYESADCRFMVKFQLSVVEVRIRWSQTARERVIPRKRGATAKPDTALCCNYTVYPGNCPAACCGGEPVALYGIAFYLGLSMRGNNRLPRRAGRNSREEFCSLAAKKGIFFAINTSAIPPWNG